jgi:phage shock protein A
MRSLKMTALLEKVSTLVSANLHALVDQALKSNSLAVIDQYMRQVGDQLENLEEAAATVGGEIKTLQRKLVEQESKAAQMDQAIDGLLLAGNQAEAAAAQSHLNGVRQLVETYQEQKRRLQGEYDRLLDARTQLQGRFEMMKQQRIELQALLDLAKSKESVVKAVKSLDDLLGSGDNDISGVAQSIYARLDRANAAIELRATSLDEQIDRLLDRQAIEAQLAERRKKLALEN